MEKVRSRLLHNTFGTMTVSLCTEQQAARPGDKVPLQVCVCNNSDHALGTVSVSLVKYVRVLHRRYLVRVIG